MSSLTPLAALPNVLPDTRPKPNNAVAAVQAVAPAVPSRRVADGLPEEVPLEPTEREQAALAEINQALALASIGLQFEFDKESDQMIARVVDISSGELIRQMPSEEMLQVAKMLDKLQGLIFQRVA